VKPLAKELIARFGAFADVVSTDPECLAEVAGMGDNVITALKVVQAAAVRLVRS
jgi:DNA repair protein RadC